MSSDYINRHNSISIVPENILSLKDRFLLQEILTQACLNSRDLFFISRYHLVTVTSVIIPIWEHKGCVCQKGHLVFGNRSYFKTFLSIPINSSIFANQIPRKGDCFCNNIESQLLAAVANDSRQFMSLETFPQHQGNQGQWDIIWEQF